MLKDFYPEKKHLNIKKIIIIIAIIIIILIAIIAIFKKHSNSSTKEISTDEVSDASTTFYSNDNSVSVELSNNLNLEKYNSDYLLSLHSDNNLNIFISKEDAMENKELSDIVNADKLAYVENFDYANLSDIKELVVNEKPAYTYSFQYLDKNLNKAFYIQIVWLQIDNTYYTFDIEFPQEDLSFYTNLASSILSSFKVN